MSYKIHIVAAAKKDMIELYKYVAKNDSREKADRLLENIEFTCASLTNFPERGHIPSELERIALFEYREIHYKPYRIIYHIKGDEVFIHSILDGRRDIQTELEKRFLR